MDIRDSYSSEYVKTFNTEKLRKAFLIENLFRKDEISFTYSHIDRVMTGGVQPVRKDVYLSDINLVGVEYFLERREMGVLNLGGEGRIDVDGVKYPLQGRDALYIPKESKTVIFSSNDENIPAKLYLISAAAHKVLPAGLIKENEAKHISLGSQENVNKRVLNQYLHPDVIETCQLSMGITDVMEGNAWNTFPPHTHDRRMEVYLYFNISDENMVFHLMGEGNETRHIVIRNDQAVLSPSWSIHAGVGTAAYSFIWAMAGENQTFNDMDHIPMAEIK